MVDDSPNAQVELAAQRTELAVERTQLAWVRTAFALISAGLAVAKGSDALHKADKLVGIRWVQSGHIGGIVVILAAVAFLAFATVSYGRKTREIARHHQVPAPQVPLALPISVFVMLLGCVLAGLLMAWG